MGPRSQETGTHIDDRTAQIPPTDLDLTFDPPSPNLTISSLSSPIHGTPSIIPTVAGVTPLDRRRDDRFNAVSWDFGEGRPVVVYRSGGQIGGWVTRVLVVWGGGRTVRYYRTFERYDW